MMARMAMDYKMDFGKLSRIYVFQIVKFSLEIFEILRKCCCNTKFLQKTCFLSFSESCYYINLGSISSIYKSFERIHLDIAPLNKCK